MKRWYRGRTGIETGRLVKKILNYIFSYIIVGIAHGWLINASCLSAHIAVKDLSINIRIINVQYFNSALYNKVETYFDNQ
jgi:hypoxanthine phosphoribosyltransferase